VVLVLDEEYDDSPWCKGELDGFLENCRRATAAPAPGGAAAQAFPGSAFQLLVVYEQAVFGAEKLAQLRARFEGVARVEFFAAWFSCFKPGSLVNPEAAAGVAEAQMVAKAETRGPRVPRSFAPHGIVGAGCAKDAGGAGCAAGAVCVACVAERRRFIAAVQREDDRVRAAAGAGRDTYCALYNLHWQAQAHRLLRQGMLGDKAAAEKAAAEMVAEPEPEPEPEPELDHSSPRSRPAPTPKEVDADSCTIS
jgi:hypothetical protein